MKGVLKFLSVLIIIICIIVIILVLFGKGLGFGEGTGSNGDGTGDSVVRTTINQNIESDNSIEEKSVDETVQEPEETIVKISVVERDYYCDNERITLDQFVEKVKLFEGKVIVEIKDDNAALNTYNDLIDILDQERIHYIEYEE